MSKEEILKKYHLDQDSIKKNSQEREQKYCSYDDKRAITLYYYCWEGKNERAIDFIKKGVPFYYRWYKSDKVSVSLLATIFKNNLELFVTLLQYGCPYECVFSMDTSIDWTPLSLAAFYGRSEMVQILLAMDANLYLQTSYGTALEIASHSSIECYKMISEAKENFERNCASIIEGSPYGYFFNRFTMYILDYCKAHSKTISQECLRYLANEFLSQNQHSLETEALLDDFLKEIWNHSTWNNGEKEIEERSLRTILNHFLLARDYSEMLNGAVKQRMLS